MEHAACIFYIKRTGATTANKEQLVTLFERHADLDESVGEVLEGPIRVPMLKVQRTMLRDMFHPKVSAMNRTDLLSTRGPGWDH